MTSHTRTPPKAPAQAPPRVPQPPPPTPRPRPRPRRRRGRPPLQLQFSPGARRACVALNLLPLPGVGAVWAGWRNPHSRLLRNGLLQILLVVAGSWPLVVPGAAGLAWAAWDAVRISQAQLVPRPPKLPKGAPPVPASGPAVPATPGATTGEVEARPPGPPPK